MDNARKKLYLHIGYFKTGTSFIQKFLSDNAKSMLDYGVCYPTVGRPRNNLTTHSLYPLKALDEAGITVPPWFSRKEKNYARPAKNVLDELAAESRWADSNTVIISSEEFIRFSSLEDPLTNIRDVINAFPDFDVKVILYLREPASYLESWYNQVTKMGPTARFPRFFLNVPKQHTNYADVVSDWASAIGKDNIIMKPHVHSGVHHLADFLSSTGIGIPESELAGMISKKPVNVSLQSRALESKRIANHAATGRPFWKFLANFDNHSFLRKNEAKIQERCSEINNQMEQLVRDYNFEPARRWKIDLSHISAIEDKLNNLAINEEDEFILKVRIYYRSAKSTFRERAWLSSIGTWSKQLFR